MILEFAQIDIKPGLEDEFENAVRQSRAVFDRATGFRTLQLRRCVDKPGRYHLLVEWDRLENHTVDFLTSENFAAWRSLVGHCFISIPSVEHSEQRVVFERSDTAVG